MYLLEDRQARGQMLVCSSKKTDRPDGAVI